jgi:hypothetical protein
MKAVLLAVLSITVICGQSITSTQPMTIIGNDYTFTEAILTYQPTQGQSSKVLKLAFTPSASCSAESFTVTVTYKLPGEDAPYVKTATLLNTSEPEFYPVAYFDFGQTPVTLQGISVKENQPAGSWVDTTVL